MLFFALNTKTAASKTRWSSYAALEGQTLLLEKTYSQTKSKETIPTEILNTLG